jgi:beta-xylosidase
MSTPESEVGTTLHGRVSWARWLVSVVVLVAAQLIAAQLILGSNQRAGAATGTTKASGVTRASGATRAIRASQGAEPTPLITTYVPGRMILKNDVDPTDPYLLKVGGLYYLYTSEGTTFLNVPLWIGTKPGQWDSLIDAMPTLPAWAQGGLTWAPDVQKVAGGWALYFSAALRGVSPSTHCIGAAFAQWPTGPFVATAQPFICQLAHRGSIDARVFAEADGHLVMMWKSEDNANPSVPGPDQGGDTGIYAQDLSADGRTLLGAAVKILAPSQPWESTIVEAPDMVEAWGTYWLFFSGNWYNSTNYGIGVAECQGPLGPCADPDSAPFLGPTWQGLGPGEESLFEDGGAVYLLYNSFRASAPDPVISQPVAMARIGFTPMGPYLAAF